MIKNKIKKLIICILILGLIFLIKCCNCFAITIALDPGHGGGDTGAIGQNVYERDLNLKVAKYLRDYLNEYDDITVLMTHEGQNAENMTVLERGMFALNNNADLLLSLHFNSSSTSNVHGTEIFVTRCRTFDKYNKNTTELSNIILNNFSKLGIDITRGIKTRLCSDDEIKYKYSDGEQADYYGVIRYAMRGDSVIDYGIPIDSGIGVPTILIEHCFLTGTVDFQYYDSENDLQNLAKSECEAIVQYYGLSKIDSTKVKLIMLDKNKEDLALGDEKNINATVYPSTAINQKLTYGTSNANVATVDENGKVIPVSKGTAIITITSDDGGKTATYTVNVVDAGIYIENEQINMIVGKTAQINATATPSSLSNKQLTYTSSDEDIATVNENGLVTGVAVGTATITVKSSFNNSEKQVTIRVNDAEKYTVEVNTQNRNLSNNVISKIEEKTLVTNILSDMTISENLEIAVLNHKNENMSVNDYITTGSKIVIKDSTTKDTITEFYIVVTGDVNRDGKISPSDYVLIKNHIMDKSKITGIQLDAADVKKDGNISPADYVLIKNHIMETKKITPQ